MQYAAAPLAALGATLARVLRGIDKPRVATLSVGVEEGKGNRQVKETAVILKNSPLNYVGNVEGSDLPYDRADVVVADGFTGNVVMKLTESLGEAISELIRNKGTGEVTDELADEIRDLTNPVSLFGGGPLLGVKGIAIVGHGRATAEVVSRAIHTARELVEKDFVGQAERELADLRASQPVT